jgi:hypothetical protein
MAPALVLPFPPPSGLTQDDLERLYRFAADHPGAQIDILVSRNRRTSAILALAERHLRIERDGEAVLVRDAFSGPSADQATANGDLLDTLQAALSVEDEPWQPRTASGG